MSASCRLLVMFADAINGWPHLVRYDIISSCRSAVTAEILKRYWPSASGQSRVRSVITSFGLYLNKRLAD